MKNDDLNQLKNRFQQIMDWYRNAYGAKKFEPAALEMGFDELHNINLDRLEDIIREIARTEDEAMNMTKLVKAIKLKQRPVVRFVEPSTREQIELNPEDAELVRKNMARFERFKQIAAERGRAWWEEVLMKSLEFVKCGNIFPSLAKNGPGCFMNWTMCGPWLKKQPIWAELEAAATAPQTREIRASELRSNVRVFPKTQHLGNAAAYRAGN